VPVRRLTIDAIRRNHQMQLFMISQQQTTQAQSEQLASAGAIMATSYIGRNYHKRNNCELINPLALNELSIDQLLMHLSIVGRKGGERKAKSESRRKVMLVQLINEISDSLAISYIPALDQATNLSNFPSLI
jgi:hypothetical protein